MKSSKITQLIKMLLAWGIIPLAYLSWCLSTVCYINGMFAYLSVLVGIGTAICYGILSKHYANDRREPVKQFAVLDFGILLAGVLVSWTTVVEKLYYISVIACVWILVAILGIYNNKLILKQAIRGFVISHKAMIIVSFALILILIIDSDIQFKWDGLLYYTAVKQANLGSVSSVALYGHIAMFCGSLMRLWADIFGNIGIGMYAANVCMLVVGVWSFYGVLKTIVKGLKESTYIIATCIYMLSPYLFGMVGYYSLDYYTICLMPTLLYCVLNKQWILSTTVACMFVLTKEPALIAYGGVCVGLLIYDLVEYRGKLKERLLHVFSEVHYYFLLIPLFLWLGTYKILGGWSAGNGGFGFDIPYVMDKLKVFFLFNWSWIFSVLIIVLGIYVYVSHKLTDNIEWICPLICSNLSLLLFNVVFKTVNHPRYIDSFVVVNYILAIGMLLSIVSESKAKVYNILLSVIAVVQLLACFITYDPVTIELWTCSKVGSLQIATTSGTPYGDGAIYNRQMLDMEHALDMAIDDAIKDGSAIAMSITGGAVNLFDGMSEYNNQSDVVCREAQYWDTKNSRRVTYADEHREGDGVIEIEVYHVLDDGAIRRDDIGKDKLSIIYVKDINDYAKPKGYALVTSKQYSYRGWTISRDVYEKK